MTKMKYSKFYSGVVIIALLLFFHLGILVRPSDSSIINITILPKVEIERDNILLGEVAEIRSEDQRLLKKLDAIVLGKAPLPGKSRSIDEGYVKIRLKQNGIDLSEVILCVPPQNKISRGFVKIGREKIKKAVLDFIYLKIPWQKEMVKIRHISVGQDVILPKGKVTYQVLSPENLDFLRNLHIAVAFKVNNRPCKKIWVTVDIDVFMNVVVTKRPVGRHKIITEDDVCLKEKDISDLPSNIILNCEEVYGKRAGRAIKSKTVLRADLVDLPPLVKRGDVVLIVAELEGIRVTALGEVKGRGRRGDRIKVVNIDSKKLLYAQVVDSKMVKVKF